MWLSHSPYVPTCSSKELVTSPVLLSPASGSPERELIGPGLLSCGSEGRVAANPMRVGVCAGLVRHPRGSTARQGVVLPCFMPEKLEALRG